VAVDLTRTQVVFSTNRSAGGSKEGGLASDGGKGSGEWFTHRLDHGR